jgi:hypothetical protein
MTVAPIRSAIVRCAEGGIMWSSVATRYQLGLFLQAASLTIPLGPPTPHGTCASAMNAASSGVIGGKSGDVAESSDLLVGSRRSDDGTAVRVADENRRAVLLVQDAAGDGDVIFERQRRVLDDADVEAILFEELVDTLPAGSIHEAAVNQRDVPYFTHDDLRSSCLPRNAESAYVNRVLRLFQRALW